MKTKWIKTFGFLGSLWWACLGAAQATEKMKLSVMQIEPWGIIEKDSSTSGIYVELTRALAEAAGFQPVIKVVPYSRVVLDMRSGESVFCFMTMNPEIKEAAKEIGVLKVLDLIVIGKEGLKIESLKDLEGKTVATLLGTHHLPDFDNNPKIAKNPVKSPEQQIQLLALGRAEAIEGVREATYYAAQQLNKNGKQITLSKAPFVLDHINAYLHISNKHDTPELRQKLMQGLETLKASGQIEKSFQKYIQE